MRSVSQYVQDELNCRLEGVTTITEVGVTKEPGTDIDVLHGRFAEGKWFNVGIDGEETALRSEFLDACAKGIKKAFEQKRPKPELATSNG